MIISEFGEQSETDETLGGVFQCSEGSVHVRVHVHVYGQRPDAAGLYHRRAS